MAQDVNLAVRIATVLDAAGLNKADKSVKGFEKSLKSLGRTLGITLSTAAFVQFSRKSVQAFVEAEKANTRLANSVKNLGLSFSTAAIQKNLDEISASAGIAGEVLVDAYQPLLTATGSVLQSQKMLNLALDVSAGSGVALTTVTQDLANAYVGNTRGLRKYNLGLSQAQLKAATFLEVQTKLNKQFSGAQAQYLDTYAGKMQILGEAAGNAQERLGGAIIDFGMAFTGSSNIDQLIGKIETLTDRAVGFLDRITEGVRILNAIRNSSLNTIQKNIQDAQVAEYNRRMRRDYMKAWDGVNIPQSAQATAQARKAEAAAKKRAADLLKSQQKNTAELKKQNTLKKSASVFDLEQIQLIAALRGKLSEEDRKRIEAQLALLNNNDALAQKLTREILMAQDATGGLYRYFLTIGDAKIKNPFAFLDEWIMEFQSKLNNLKFPTGNGATATVVAASTPSVTVTNSGASITSSATMGTPFGQAGSFVDSMGTPFGQAGSYVDSMGTPFGQAGTTVVVNVSGSVISEQDLTETIARNLQNSSLSSGKVAQLERYSGFFL
jgi:hypothetical protein